jgi:hypothetical protein
MKIPFFVRQLQMIESQSSYFTLTAFVAHWVAAVFVPLVSVCFSADPPIILRIFKLQFHKIMHSHRITARIDYTKYSAIAVITSEDE